MKEIRIAIANDHELIRTGLASIVNGFAGCRIVAEGENGADLISNINALDVLPDICLIDISMPAMDGYTATLHLAKHHPGIGLIALTVYTGGYAVSRMVQNGIHAYLHSGISPSELRRAIAEVYTNGYYYSKYATRENFEFIKMNRLPDFTKADLNYIQLACQGLTYKQIAEAKYVSIHTVQEHFNNICHKAGVHTRAELEAFAYKAALIPVSLS